MDSVGVSLPRMIAEMGIDKMADQNINADVDAEFAAMLEVPEAPLAIVELEEPRAQPRPRIREEVRVPAQIEDLVEYNPREDDLEEVSLDHLTYDDKMRVEATINNAGIILMADDRFSGLVRFDEFKDAVCVVKDFRPRDIPSARGYRMKKFGEPIEKHQIASIAAAIQSKVIDRGFSGGYECRVSPTTMESALEIEAFDNPFNSLQDFITSKQWDGVPRLRTYLRDYLGSPDDAYHQEAGRLWLIGAVARAFEPGIKFDYCLTLMGSQGLSKSTFFTLIGGEFYNSINASCMRSKSEFLDATIGTWINEIADMAGMEKVSQRTIKAMITDSSDRARRAYRRDGKEYKRTSVFGATANEGAILEDPTGGRRFWPVQVSETANIRMMEPVVGHLIAEAAREYAQMRAECPKGDLPLFLPPEIEKIAFKKQAEIRVHDDIDTIADAIRDYVESSRGIGFGDGDYEGHEFLLEYHPREIFAAITGKPESEYVGSGFSHKMGQAMRRIDYLSTSTSASLIRRLKIKTRKIVVDKAKFLPHFIDRLVEEGKIARPDDTPPTPPAPKGPARKDAAAAAAPVAPVEAPAATAAPAAPGAPAAQATLAIAPVAAPAAPATFSPDLEPAGDGSTPVATETAEAAQVILPSEEPSSLNDDMSDLQGPTTEPTTETINEGAAIYADAFSQHDLDVLDQIRSEHGDLRLDDGYREL